MVLRHDVYRDHDAKVSGLLPSLLVAREQRQFPSPRRLF
jgi:hypothetical protein